MIWKNIWAFLLGLIYLYLQLLVMPAFELWGVIPNILIPWLVYLVWTRELTPALIIGFVIGLMYDTTQPEAFGSHALIFTLMALATDQFRKPFESESVVARLLTLFVANLIFHLIEYLVFGVVYGFGPSLSGLVGIAFAYDLVLSFVIFWSLQIISRLKIVADHD